MSKLFEGRITMNICVFGAASDEIDRIYIEKIEEFGEKMAKRGHNLIFGAGKFGLMGACARGVTKAGGKITGVIPHFFKENSIEHIYEECDEVIFTDTMAQRKAKMEDLADAFVIVPGGIGTFEEAFEVLTLKQLGRHTKPIAFYDIEGYYKTLEDMLDIAFNKGFIRSDCKKLYHYCTDSDDVLSYIENDKREKINVLEMKNG